jgi:hypothetical protein
MNIKNFNDFLIKESDNIIDFILDKINRVGIQNISQKDKDILDGAISNQEVNISQIENFIFNLLCDGESEDNILDDVEEITDIYSFYIKPIYDWCFLVFNNVVSFLNTLEEAPDISHFFDYYSSYNTSNYSNLFGDDRDWAIEKSFKEVFESHDIYFEDDDYFELVEKIKKCFKVN